MGTTFTLCLALFGLNPVGNVTADTVDLIEVNHYYDESGRFVFKQIIFFDWCPRQCRYNVRAWRLIRSDGQLPKRDVQRRNFVAIWQDGTQFRRVKAKNYRQSWTQYDPEQFERRFVPKGRRKELAKKFERKKRGQ